MEKLISFIVVLLVLFSFHPMHAQDIGAETVSSLKRLHAGKAGVYVRLGGRDKKMLDLIGGHPLVDAVIGGSAWRVVEPQRGNYSFTSLVEEIEQWGKKGKGVALNVVLYGQAVDDALTPPWLYEQTSVRAISFSGGGQAKGRTIRVPAVWDEGFLEKYVEPMVEALARALDGNPAVWYVIPAFGHIGAMTAQPSKEGAQAFLKAGWTVEKWNSYCRRTVNVYQRHFKKTPLFLKFERMFIRDRKHRYYEKEAAELAKEFGKKGVALIHLGLEADKESMMEAYRNLTEVIPVAHKGITRIGRGDDWPLWVPESRRQHKPTQGHDDKYFQKSLENAFGGLEGVPQVPTTILFCQEPEILASHPASSEYRPAVGEILKNARTRLKKVDQGIFGGN